MLLDYMGSVQHYNIILLKPQNSDKNDSLTFNQTTRLQFTLAATVKTFK